MRVLAESPCPQRVRAPGGRAAGRAGGARSRRRVRGGALFTEPSFLFLTRGPQWLQAKELVGPVARGADGSVAAGGARGPGPAGPRGGGGRSPSRHSRWGHALQRPLNCGFRSALPDCSALPRGGGSADAGDKCLHTDSPLATVNVCRGHQATAHPLAPAPPPS